MIARREELKRRLAAARERLEAQALPQAEKEQAEYERKLAARQARAGAGQAPKVPSGEPEAQQQSNLTDADSRLMRRTSGPSSSPKGTSDGGRRGKPIDSGAGGEPERERQGELAAGVTAIPRELGQPEAVLADNGYANGAEVERVKGAGVVMAAFDRKIYSTLLRFSLDVPLLVLNKEPT